MDYGMLTKLERVVKRFPNGKWFDESSFILRKDPEGMAFLSASGNVIEVVTLFAIAPGWLESFPGKLFLWGKRRQVRPYLIAVDNGLYNLRIRLLAVGNPEADIDVEGLVAEMEAIGTEIRSAAA